MKTSRFLEVLSVRVEKNPLHLRHDPGVDARRLGPGAAGAPRDDPDQVDPIIDGGSHGTWDRKWSFLEETSSKHSSKLYTSLYE